jgi:hypothetical protein
MRKIIHWVHTSVDGFVDGPNGEFDWPVMSLELSAYSRSRGRPTRVRAGLAAGGGVIIAMTAIAIRLGMSAIVALADALLALTITRVAVRRTRHG